MRQMMEDVLEISYCELRCGERRYYQRRIHEERLRIEKKELIEKLKKVIKRKDAKVETEKVISARNAEGYRRANSGS